MRDRLRGLSTFVFVFLAAAGLACTPRPAGANQARLNADGVLVIDGKKVFPIGFTMPPPPDGKTPDGKNGIAELHDAGATFLRTGASGGPWDEATIVREQAWEDAAARFGMHCWVFLRELDSLQPGDTRREAMLRQVVNRFKNHPGMGVWKGVDEPDWGKEPVAPIEAAYRLIHTLDPNHPVALTQAPRGTLASMQRYNSAADITGADVYPISYPPGIHSLLPNKEISMVGDYTRTMMQVGEGKLPVWMILQIAWSGVARPTATLRYPTFPQERFMTYEAIINGARGLIYFGGNVKSVLTPEDARLGWNWNFWKRVLRPVITEIGDRSALYPALVAPESAPGVKTTGGVGMEFCVREVGDDLFLLACKREGPTERVQFSGLPAWVTRGDVLYEAPRSMAAVNGGFTDWFAPFDVHVYRFRRAAASTR